ncbi:MAG TPA: undecaprenyldiphospho-muramoylpentapeptide beta-N-acetylglucosaminyltransferase [Acidimicrobiales bacterium]
MTQPDRRATWAVIAGGGTAGHALPAVAIGRALVEAGHPAPAIHFVGSRRGIEGRLVPEAGFSITLLPGRGVARQFTLRSMARNIGAVAGLVAATVQAVVLVGRRRPAVIISVGGYASVPCVVAAVLLRVPLLVAEQNAVPGAANRMAARFARAAATSFESTDLPRAVVTGNPVRPEVANVTRDTATRTAARTALGLPAEGTVVAAFGGSLGARRINQAVVELASRWSDRSGLTLLHIVGKRDWEAFSGHDRAQPAGGLCYRQVCYEDRMNLVYAAADVAVCRAGASTVAELAAAGLPAILIPLPGAPGDHQTANARALVDAGAARIIPDQELTAATLAAELSDFLAEPAILAHMSAAARSVARPDAAARVARLAEEHARGAA